MPRPFPDPPTPHPQPSGYDGDRRSVIRLAATDLFAELGYRAVGMRMIAEAVGIRTSTIYHHFPSKEDLLHSIALDYTREFIEDSASTLGAGDPPAVRLSRLVHAHIVYFSEHRREEAVGLRELRELTPEHQQEVRADLRRYQERFRDLIAEGVGDGTFVVPDPDVAAIAVLSMMNAINTWFRAGGRLTTAAVADMHVTMILQLLGAPAHGATTNGVPR